MRHHWLSLLLLGSVFAVQAVLVPATVAGRGPAPFRSAETDLSKLAVGQNVRFKLRSGGKPEGIILEITADTIRIQAKFGVVPVKKDEVESFEVVKSNADIYAERAAACQSADDWFELGKWAEGVGEAALAREAYEKTVELDGEHAGAHEALGEVKHEGQWMPLEEAMKAQGKEFYRGEWRTKEEIARLKAEEEKAQAEKKLAGLEAQEAEYRGRNWADIDPIVTPHYNLWCDSTVEVAERYADVMEALFTQYDRVFKKKYFPRNPPPGGRSNVWIHKNHRQFMEWTGSPPGVGGFFRPHPTLRDVTGYHGSFGTTGSTEEVLAHEGTHQFQSMIFKNMNVVPTWTIEGMAVYFGDGSEISRNSVKINVIPRDRLVGLQAAIEDGNYCPLKTLIRLRHAQFSGFFYGHGWGIYYWLLYGNKSDPKAWKGTVGHDIINEWLIYCRDLESPDLGAHAGEFERLLTENTGQTIDEWEEEYKQWILQLEVKALGKMRGSRWISESLGVEVLKPAGWTKVKDTKLNPNEAVAFSGSSSKVRRIATVAIPNFSHAELTPILVGNVLSNMFQDLDYEGGAEAALATVYGLPAQVAEFKGRRVKAAAGTVGSDQAESGEQSPILRYKVVVYGTYDKIYANVLEAGADQWASCSGKFEKYLEKFKITY